jgi:hypothetical protein
MAAKLDARLQLLFSSLFVVPHSSQSAGDNEFIRIFPDHQEFKEIVALSPTGDPKESVVERCIHQLENIIPD